MSGSREESPDWLRTFEAPTQSILTLSSGSESSPNDSPSREDKMNEKEQSPKETHFLGKEDDQECGEESSFNKTLKRKSPNRRPKVDHKSTKKMKADNCSEKGNGVDGKDAEKEKFEKHIEPNAPNNSVWNLSSDSESPYNSPSRKASRGKSPKKGLKTEDPVPAKKKRVNGDISKKGKGTDGVMEIAEEEVAEKNIESRFSSSRLPLVLSEKASRTKALVECEGESIELSGDVGAVGRVVISDNPSGNHEMFLDLKGTMYKTTIVPSRTFCVVSFGQSEAKIEAIMNDFIQLKPQSNVYEAETMVEGTLEGFSFDSEDDADNVPKTAANQTDQNEGSAEQSNKKAKTKAEKSSGVARKRGKVAGGKPPKKAKKKTQAPKKGKAKK